MPRPASTPRPPAPGRAPRRLGEPYLTVLAFAAEHRCILTAHVQALLGVSWQSANRRLTHLTRTGYLRSDRPLTEARWYQVQPAGLRAVDSRLPRPRSVDMATYEHDVGMGWVWLAATRGAFGATRALVSERGLRAQDGRTRRFELPAGVRLIGLDSRGEARRHYPDLVLETAGGHRVAVELELTAKSSRRLEDILGGYAMDARFDAVVYLVDRPQVGEAVRRAAASVRARDLVHVQSIAWGRGAGAISPGRGTERVCSTGRSLAPTTTQRG